MQKPHSNTGRTLAPLAVLVLSAAACTTTEAKEPTEEPHVAITTERLEPYECGSIQRMHTFGGVFLASQPQPEDFEQAKKGGVRTVINLRHPEELTFDEPAVVEGLGLTYYNPAWNGVAELTDELLDETRTLLDEAERPILLHCSSSNRVGAVWLAYRALDDGLSIEDSLVEAREVGLRSPDYERRVLDYIRARREATPVSP